MLIPSNRRLREVDVKAEQFGHQVQRLEQERDRWEQKYEDALSKSQQSKRELDEVIRSIGDL